jgi:hypothetical protein
MSEPGDQAAFDRCRHGLNGGSVLKRSLRPIVLWGRLNKNAGTGIKETTLTQFAPDVLAGMYVPLFMFSGKHTVEFDAREKLYLVRVETAFRNRLQPGQFPYPFWHDASKWNTYQGANSILLWIDPASASIKVAQFTDRGTELSAAAMKALPPQPFDGQWMWTDSEGHAQPQVTLFDGMFRSDNPYLHQLDAAYRSLALKLRAGQCDTCHTPDNPNQMRRIVLLQTPAHAAGEIKRIMKSVREDRMPRDSTGIEEPLETNLKNALLDNAAQFDKLLDAAKQWDHKR